MSLLLGLPSHLDLYSIAGIALHFRFVFTRDVIDSPFWQLGLDHVKNLARPVLRVEVSAKDQKELRKLVSGGVQQVRVVLRALALLQLAKGATAPHIAGVIPLTAQAIRNIGRRYQQGGLDGRSMKDSDPEQPRCSTIARNNV